MDAIDFYHTDGCSSDIYEAMEQYAKYKINKSNRLICDCMIPKPKDPYCDVDKYICGDCEGDIITQPIKNRAWKI